MALGRCFSDLDAQLGVASWVYLGFFELSGHVIRAVFALFEKLLWFLVTLSSRCLDLCKVLPVWINHDPLLPSHVIVPNHTTIRAFLLHDETRIELRLSYVSRVQFLQSRYFHVLVNLSTLRVVIVLTFRPIIVADLLRTCRAFCCHESTLDRLKLFPIGLLYWCSRYSLCHMVQVIVLTWHIRRSYGHSNLLLSRLICGSTIQYVAIVIVTCGANRNESSLRHVFVATHNFGLVLNQRYIASPWMKLSMLIWNDWVVAIDWAGFWILAAKIGHERIHVQLGVFHVVLHIVSHGASWMRSGCCALRV